MTPRPWSKLHDRCVDCASTERPHHAGGLCRRCYDRHHYHLHLDAQHARQRAAYHADPERHKAGMRAWRERNPEHWRQIVGDYLQCHRERINAQRRDRYRRKQRQAAGRTEGDVVADL